MWNYLEKHSMVKYNGFDEVCKNEWVISAIKLA